MGPPTSSVQFGALSHPHRGVLPGPARPDRLLLDLRGAQLLVVPVPTPPDGEHG